MSGFDTLKTSLLKNFDGSDREPRASQIEALSWLADNWSSPGLVLQLPTGVGKSAIARAIQLQTGASIVTPNNALLDQYGESYPTLNTLRGAATYECGIEEDHSFCGPGCGYLNAKRRSEVEPTVYNPLSYIYGAEKTKILVVDEAHKLVDFLRLLIGYKFSKDKYSPPPKPGPSWIRTKAANYNAIGTIYKEQGDFKKSSKNFQAGKRLNKLADTVERNPDNFVTYWKDDAWIIEPLEVPREMIEQALGEAHKVILLSATIPPKWAQEILGARPFKYLDLASPIPKENRKVVFDSAGLKASSSPAEVAAWIKRQLERFDGNAIVHTTYALGTALADYFPEAFIHTKKTKQSTMAKFKKQGGLWIAAGAAEGIDLAGDTARVNLIPILPFANNTEPREAAMFKQDPYQYYLTTAVTFVQQCGRTTRGDKDWSVAVCGDSRLPWLLQKCAKDLPAFFREGLVWN
jgi:Rad3-related DNA helicase